jgi:stage IV sporulation protein FA
MRIRNDVRDRRRKRIAQLVGEQAFGQGEQAAKTKNDAASPLPDQEGGRFEAFPMPPSKAESLPPVASLSPEGTKSDFSAPGRSTDPDPELWWKEQERRLKSGQVPGWSGLKGLAPTSLPPGGYSSDKEPANRFIRGLAVRFAVAAIVFAGIWGWLKLDMPGSVETRAWMVGSVTTDMDFQTIEAWYGDTFGGSPSFFPFNRNESDTKEVSVKPGPLDTAPPIKGKIVQGYARNGKGVKIAAAGNSKVYAVYTGWVQQVTQDQTGGITVLVQHQNHLLTVYGGLAKASVKAKDWVETGEALGQLGPAADGNGERLLYFAVQQGEQTIDPAEVVSFD